MSGQADPAVTIVARHGGRGLAAARDFAAGETILEAEGVVRAAPSRTTVQIADDEHLDVPEGAGPDAFAWRYLNHACRPNAAFHGRRLVALVPIPAGAELTFDYETTEWELSTPFVCACGSAGCAGRPIRGFRHLSPAQRAARAPQLRAGLRARVGGA